jgi:hypothetical protein
LQRSHHDKILANSWLCLEFNQLTQTAAIKKCNQIKADTATISITAQTGEILTIINQLAKEAKVQVFDSAKEVWKILSRDTAKHAIEISQSESCLIKIENVTLPLAENIIEAAPNAEFNISFINVDSRFDQVEEGGQTVNVSFAGLECEQSKLLISKIRQENAAFSLGFDNLTAVQAQQAVAKADLSQQDILIASKLKTLSDLFTKDLRPTIELQELAARCIEYLLDVNERKFLPWRSMVVMGVIAGVQMGLGAALISTGVGAKAGLAFMTEGAADLVNTAKIGITRQHSWSDYGQQKAISLAISAFSLGWTGIKDAGTGIKSLVTGLSHRTKCCC